MKSKTDELLALLGGRENVKNCSHCMTRLRIEVRDTAIVNLQGLKDSALAKGVVQSGENIQIVIGVRVKDVYSLLNGHLSSTVNDKKNLGSQKNRLSFLSEAFLPMMIWILLTGMLTIFSRIPLLNEVRYISILEGSLIQFFPIAYGYSIYKYRDKNPIIGIIFGLVMSLQNYSNNLILLSAGLMLVIYIEEFLDRFIKDPFKILFVPILTLLIGFTLNEAILAPILNPIHKIFMDSSETIFNSRYFFILSGIFGGTYALVVKRGLHHVLLFLDLAFILNGGGTFFWPIIAISNISQGSVAILKDSKAGLLAYIGITEPAMYGVNSESKKRFYLSLLASGAGASVAGFYRVKSLAIGPGGLPALLVVKSESVHGFMIAVVVTIVLGLIFGGITKKAVD
ncbi:MAG: PTS transporter subunit EIIB [Cetobacterium sp.]